MTEAELLTHASTAVTNMLTAFAILLSISSGYLLVAYSVGRELIRSQIVIINSIFSLAALFFTAISVGSMARGVSFSIAAKKVYTAGPEFLAGYSAAWLLLFICACIYIGSTKFMWDIRHPKEQP